MARDQVVNLERRRVLQGLGALSLSVAGGSLLAACSNQVAPFFAGSTGNRPETTTIRIPPGFGTCYAPLILAADLLKADGFDVKQVQVGSDADVVPAVSAGDIAVAMQTAAITTTRADADSAFVHLAGIHVGCYELFATAGIRSMRDLSGKRVAIGALGSASHIYMSAMAAYIGLDPNRDFTWVTDNTSPEAIQAFAAGQIDAFMAGPPEPQHLHKMGLGHVLVNMHTDRPWSHQFCCMLIANRAFVENNPVTAKQTVRAVLKAADLCAQDPAAAAQRLVVRGDVTDYDATFQMFTHDVSYHRWREYDPEDTVRFYGLLLHQIGMVKSTPDKIIAQSTDWRILNELKKELKA
jgi:NitT/TauT family transport system substrate-binding protein